MSAYMDLKRRVIVVDDKLSEHIAVLLESLDKIRDLISREELAPDDCVMAIDKVLHNVTGLPSIIKGSDVKENRRLRKLFEILDV